jgi:DNA-directed RNA polymerase subunit RPC12/RpoP
MAERTVPATIAWTATETKAYCEPPGNLAIIHGQPKGNSNCPTCGSRMILIRDVPRLGALPPRRVYKCQGCGVWLTETVEAKQRR